MKKLLLLCLPLLLLLGCAEEKPHETKLDYEKEGNGLVIAEAKGVLEAYQKKYRITVTVKNNGKEKSENGVINAMYYDQEGDAVHESSTVVKKALVPGESTKVEVVNDILSVAEAPYRVKLTVGDMFN